MDVGEGAQEGGGEPKLLGYRPHGAGQLVLVSLPRPLGTLSTEHLLCAGKDGQGCHCAPSWWLVRP